MRTQRSAGPNNKDHFENYQKLEDYVHTLAIDPEAQHILCGDFNINFLVKCANFGKIVTLLAGNNLFVVENIKPTRETSSTISTQHAFISNTLFSVHATVSSISDHHTPYTNVWTISGKLFSHAQKAYDKMGKIRKL